MTQAEFELGAQDLLRALRRLPRRAAQGRHRQAADARHHHRQGHRLPEGLHRLRLARRHAELADLGRDEREDRRRDGPLHPAGPAGAARVRHGADEGDLEGHRAAGAAADEEDEQLQHREHLLDHAARHRRGGADRRRHQEDHQHRQDRLRGAHLAHLGLGALPVRDRARRQDQHDRPLDGHARQRGRGAHRPRGALGGHQQVQGQGRRLHRQAGDRRRLLAAAVRDHEGRHAGAAEDRQHPRHGRRHAGIPPRAARGLDRGHRTSSPSSWSTSRRPARP